MIRTTLLLSSVIASTALAGGSATFQSSPAGQADTNLTFRWQDSHTVRMDTHGQSSYMLVRDGKAYSVTNAGGQPMVMDLSSLGKMAGQGGQSSPTLAQAQSVSEWEATGREETVAGIEGEIYQITWTDHRGKTRTDQAVLSDDDRVVAMSRAFNAFAGTMGAIAGDQNPNAFKQRLDEQELGVLRFADHFVVTRLSGETPDAEQFELPAEPRDMGKAFQGMRDAFQP